MRNEPAEPRWKRTAALDEKIEGHYRNFVARCSLPAAWYNASRQKISEFYTTHVASWPPGVLVRAL
jgi:hypothetical protein